MDARIKSGHDTRRIRTAFRSRRLEPIALSQKAFPKVPRDAGQARVEARYHLRLDRCRDALVVSLGEGALDRRLAGDLDPVGPGVGLLVPRQPRAHCRSHGPVVTSGLCFPVRAS